MKLNKLENTVWDFGNEILYKLCRENFFHNDDEVIATKTLFIGRVYAAAIERRKPIKDEKEKGDNFYIDKIIPAFKNSKLDEKLNNLNNLEFNDSNLIEFLIVHKYLIEILRKITGLEKRSFASKYLHFHLPNKFFIYDTRAVESIRKLEIKIPKQYLEILKNENIDKEYSIFYIKCLLLQKKLLNQYKKEITPREVDNFLIH